MAPYNEEDFSDLWGHVFSVTTERNNSSMSYIDDFFDIDGKTLYGFGGEITYSGAMYAYTRRTMTISNYRPCFYFESDCFADVERAADDGITASYAYLKVQFRDISVELRYLDNESEIRIVCDIVVNGVSTQLFSIVSSAWTKVSIECSGNSCLITVGSYSRTVSVGSGTNDIKVIMEGVASSLNSSGNGYYKGVMLLDYIKIYTAKAFLT